MFIDYSDFPAVPIRKYKVMGLPLPSDMSKCIVGFTVRYIK